MTPDELLSAELVAIMIRLASLRAAVASEDSFDYNQRVSTLLQMDFELQRWANALPSYWKYEVHACVPRDGFYTFFYHKYPGFSIASAWNQYRIARCLTNDLLLNYLNSSRSKNQVCDPLVVDEQCNEAQETIQKLCVDICASVPYFLHQMNPNDSPRPGVGALEVMWALFICAGMQYIPGEQRAWAIAQLDKIGHEMAVPQALPMANLIRSNRVFPESGRVFSPFSSNLTSVNT
jgi:hypothetical protein